ncbi:fatty-acyl-CoA synthase [Aromatoleum tolulyticum]|uniref:Fatty-acyl-CoA synthase n=1 Tax=Aromatoleum tolulyticum TaxID=34027 RepID=A0A1N6RMB5_9RHOO|nr:long-chain-fatty-acid--CoA ligase [Aromatoleum tolulyticum]SIQ29917.1 fatty-acyl-CoA synthase [Aromatoleum tolulyticum]
MQGLMMQLPLLISGLIAHADRNHGDITIVSRLAEDPHGPLHRTTWRETHRRARQLANALAHLSVRQGDRVATLAWNTHRHLELYYAVAGSGAVCHTVNPRLFDDQIAWILAHADAQVLFFDATFADIVARIAHKLPQVTHFVQMTGREHLPAKFPRELLAYEDLVHRHSEHYAWPQLDENTASSLCYTSGTTGNPKGVLYSHRSTVLHAYACALPDSFGICARDTVMPVVPMYHVNAWGLPYIAALTGARLVLPGPLLDGASLHRLIVDEGVSFSNGVPTVWAGLLQHLAQQGGGLGRLRRLAIGGSACPPAMAESFARHGVEVLRTWGMTELSPIGTVNVPRADEATLAPERREVQGLTQGRPLPGVELAILDDDGQALPHDGESFGELVVRAPWSLRQYYGREEGDGFTADGWFRTGDVATIDAGGYMHITDRAKDVIKSGGEWISSIELENILASHPAVAEAAAVAVPHPKWDERPLMAVVLKPGAGLDRNAMRAFYDGKIAHWWLPDDLVVVDEIPHTATGKINKLALRERFRTYRWQSQPVTVTQPR